MNVPWGVPPYLLHPLLVHFPLALLILGFGARAAADLGWGPGWLRPCSSACLTGGTLLLWGVLALGLLAERTAPHVPDAWRVMLWHKRAAFATACVFTLASAAEAFGRGRAGSRKAVLALWALGCGLLAYTGHLGAALVYTYGVGSPPS